MYIPHHCTLAAAAVLGFLSVGVAYANDTRVPQTGSQQGEIVPNALPGGEAPHARLPGGHVIAPSGINPQVGSQAGVQTPNAVPGSTRLTGEAQPHTDVTSPPGIVPQASEAGPNSPGSWPSSR